MDIFHLISLVGGIAFLLFGIRITSSSLERQFGGKLAKLMERVSASSAKGVIIGMVITP